MIGVEKIGLFSAMDGKVSVITPLDPFFCRSVMWYIAYSDSAISHFLLKNLIGLLREIQNKRCKGGWKWFPRYNDYGIYIYIWNTLSFFITSPISGGNNRIGHDFLSFSDYQFVFSVCFLYVCVHRGCTMCRHELNFNGYWCELCTVMLHNIYGVCRTFNGLCRTFYKAEAWKWKKGKYNQC